MPNSASTPRDKLASVNKQQQLGRLGGLASWAKTPDRTARTEKPRRFSPSSIEYHFERLGPQFDNATDKQRFAAAEAAKKAYFARLALKSVAARAAKSSTAA